MGLSRAIVLAIATVTSVASVVTAQPTPAPTGDGSAGSAAPVTPAPATPGSATPVPATPVPEKPEPSKPTPPEDENLLAHINDEPAATPNVGDETVSFGSQLQLFRLQSSWSGYGDVIFSMTPKDRKSATFDATHFNPIMTMRITDHVSGEIEIEYEHGGSEILVEYSVLDWSPTGSRELTFRIGKFLVPIGRFNEQLHPSFRWNQVSRPLMMRDVVPAVWGEVGLQVRGTVGSRTSLDYAAYVVNGLGSEMVDPMDDEPIRHLRGNVEDNNFDKAVGGRLAITQRASTKQSVSFGLSGYSGKIDPAGSERLTIIDADAQIVFEGLTINAELAKSYFGRKGDYFESFERGAYVQAAYAFGKTTLAGRYDYARTGTLTGPREVRQQAVGTVRYSPSPAWSLRLELAVPFVPDNATDDTTILSMVSFVF